MATHHTCALATITSMKKSITILHVLLILSCQQSGDKSTQTSTEETNKFQKETINTLSGTSWIHQPFDDFPDCIDTLKIQPTEGTYYLCEHETEYPIIYKVENDTLYIDMYGLISELNVELGTEIKSKFKLIKSNGKLVAVFIAHEYNGTFDPVEPQYLYKELKKL